MSSSEEEDISFKRKPKRAILDEDENSLSDSPPADSESEKPVMEIDRSEEILKDGSASNSLPSSPGRKETVGNKKKIIRSMDESDSDDEIDVDKDSAMDIDESNLKSAEEDVNIYKKLISNSDLYDAEGSSDEDTQTKEVDRVDYVVERLATEEVVKKKSKNKADSKKQSKSKKKSTSAVDEIHSETQRLIRESNVSLPYHRPKQRTLAEFLNRRKTAPIVPLHTSADKLSKVWKHLEEREKTVTEFYKSESDESDKEINEREKVASTEVSLNDTNQHLIPDDSSSNKLDEIPIQEVKDSSDDIVDDGNSVEADNPVDVEKKIDSTSNLNRDEGMQNVKINCDIAVENVISDDILCDNEKVELDNNNEELSESDPDAVNIKSTTDEAILPEKDSSQFSDVSKSQNFSVENSLVDIQLNITPKISGSTDGLIELDDSPTKPGALGLIKRFMKHAALKPKKKVETDISLSVIQTECNDSGEVVKLTEETINVKRTDTPKPGKGLTALKASLQQAIAVNREQLWAKRIQEYKLNEEEVVEEKEGFEAEWEEEEEFEMSGSETESEPEENDVRESKKKKSPKSSVFIDEEAEVSENEGEAESGDSDDDNDEVDENEEKEKLIGVTELNDESLSQDIRSNAASPEPGSQVSENPNEELFTERTLFKDTECSSPNASELMDLCSGKFNTQPIKLTELEKSSQSQYSQSMDLKLAFSEDTQTEDNPTQNYYNIFSRIIESSDEEDDISPTKKPIRRKLKLQISDDEDENEETKDKDDNEETKGENEIEPLDDAPKEEVFIDDDEEEEEADEMSGAESEVEETNVAGFFDGEAELSGSEWGSADEDENDLDDMEMEGGDEEQIDQHKLQKELGRIHMKEVLAEDNRDIKILQEMFLENGELHSDGPKRQRLYRWSNVDGSNDPTKFLDGLNSPEKIGEEDDEEEESWRKTRHDREVFLKNKKPDDYDEMDDESPIPAIKKGINKAVKPSPLSNDLLTSPDPKHPFKLLTKRGSFLSRGDKVLSKLAELTNSSCGDNPLGGKSKGKRNMVFAVVSPPKEEQPEEKDLKRKAAEMTPLPIKKLKFSPGALKKTSILEKLKLFDVNVAT